ncbi:hypothetical protein GCM10007111_22030 [Virgibacillus kapii]|uniref:Uncharacterized protein n=1 Tax=Virgibacillus kapii TaxID=1638645 RepID=A0ABQ2DIY4_9BACI|nr:hypothetical protein GCM10007111_22030 [Virgibacillus kapii]
MNDIVMVILTLIVLIQSLIKNRDIIKKLTFGNMLQVFGSIMGIIIAATFLLYYLGNWVVNQISNHIISNVVTWVFLIMVSYHLVFYYINNLKNILVRSGKW